MFDCLDNDCVVIWLCSIVDYLVLIDYFGCLMICVCDMLVWCFGDCLVVFCGGFWYIRPFVVFCLFCGYAVIVLLVICLLFDIWYLWFN